MLSNARVMRLGVVGMMLTLGTWSPAVPAARDAWAQESEARFRTGVERVALSATVRTSRGRPVLGLTEEDFDLFDSGEPRPIEQLRNESLPIRLALLVDFSGSMDVAAKRAEAVAAARSLLRWLDGVQDETSLYGFDRRLEQMHPSTNDRTAILDALQDVAPWGETSLFDAIAETGHHIADQAQGRRAIIALTDGTDNASRLTAPEVSGIASAIDVPVYIVIVVSPWERAGRSTIDDAKYAEIVSGKLGDLARWTGGDIFAATTPERMELAARQIVNELRQQYLITFEPDGRPGWHPIELRTRDESLVVRTRSGYVVPERPGLN